MGDMEFTEEMGQYTSAMREETVQMSQNLKRVAEREKGHGMKGSQTERQEETKE